MYVDINGQKYEVVVTKKMSTRNMYLRVKDDLKIYITTNTFTTNREIENFIRNNLDSVAKFINKMEKKTEKKEKFFFLGKEYDIVRISSSGITLGENKVFVNKDYTKEDIDKWLKKESLEIFQTHLDNCYKVFTRKIPYPSLTIRKMTSRGGVCNTKSKRVTLNSELIRMPLFCLDYVIYHELSHLIYGNHSKEFWNLVEENCPEYKRIRKYMKED